MKMQYRLIVSDFDGTLRRTEGGISDGNIRAISEYVEAGGVFALCTGRMASSIRPYAKELGLKGLLAAYQGAIIEDIESGKTVRDMRIPCEKAAEICRRLESRDYHIHVYDGDKFWSNKADGLLREYERICGVKAEIAPDITGTVARERIRPHKVLVMCPPEERDKAYAFAKKEFGGELYVTTSSEFLVEIVRRGSDKGGALEYLSEHYSIPLSQSVAIGDNINDLPMIRKAGLGVAVENGEKELKEAAGFITRTCDEDGVAYVIRKFGLGEEL